jgi:hypothetical protein
MTPPDEQPSLPDRYCAGNVHADRGLPAALDPLAKAGPSRIGLIEDGAMFCLSCAHELTRDGEEA